MLAVFDVDGTICDTQAVDDDCYARAIASVTGRPLARLDWAAYEEATGSAIVRAHLPDDPQVERRERDIEREFLRLLELERPDHPGEFQPIAGAIEFIAMLQSERDCRVAIATGCFASTARFKLSCCGLPLDAFPHATSSDAPRRRDIIGLAAERAGCDLSSAVYFGDGPWDVRVSGILGIPMIGIGRRHERLRALGVRSVFRDYSEPERIIEILRASKR